MKIYQRPDADWDVTFKDDASPLTLADKRSQAIIARGLAATPYPILSEEGAHAPYEERRDWTRLWVVDPLDGTKEFIKRNGEFTVNIALVEDTRPVLGIIYVPVQRRLFWGVVGDNAASGEAHCCDVTREGTLTNEQRLPFGLEAAHDCYVVVASRSHLSPETEDFLAQAGREHPDLSLHSAGSSLKFCLVATGVADVYPRFAPTMEWDTAAGQAIAVAAGCEVVDAKTGQPLTYNKPDLHNPYFMVRRPLCGNASTAL